MMTGDDEEARERREEPPPIWVEMGRYAGYGMTLAVATGVFLLAGWWLDQWIGTVPLFTVVGALVGAGAGFYHMIQHLVLMPRDRERSGGREEGGEGSGR